MFKNSYTREAANASTIERERELSGKVNRIIDQSNQHLEGLRQGLITLRADNEKYAAEEGATSQARMRINSHQAVMRRFQDVLWHYKTVQLDFKQQMEQKALRQIRFIYPEASDQEIMRLVDTGGRPAALQLQENESKLIEEMESRYADIRNLGNSVAQLQSIAIDFSDFVNFQGESVRRIEEAVETSHKGGDNSKTSLLKARRYKTSVIRSWNFCFVFALLTLAAIFLIPMTIDMARLRL
eukprot:GHVL01023657.1.p2 GENE.GHVL01023657.1~~GHVL01023657.1.p2  ORF type:complete len:241 (+),score=35.98 GHVL01023657.1:256-978(+)